VQLKGIVKWQATQEEYNSLFLVQTINVFMPLLALAIIFFLILHSYSVFLNYSCIEHITEWNGSIVVFHFVDERDIDMLHLGT
jgi:hypothetical protein